MITQNVSQDVRHQLDDIIIDVSWREIARYYFDKPAKWIHGKLDGTEGEFTDEEKEQLKNALFDFSERVRRVAQNIK